MPEGHTIHRLARDHNQWLAGQVVSASSPQGKFPEAARLDGREFRSAEAWGKHLFHHWDRGTIVHVHLGLFGRFRAFRGEAPEPGLSVRLRLATKDRTLDLIGATCCETISGKQMTAILDRLGPDPLRPDSDPDLAWEAFRKRRLAIGQAIMDQSIVCGIGNVYRAEVLLVHGLHPLTPTSEIDLKTWRDMWNTLQTWMEYGVRSGKIVTTDPDEVGRPRYRMRKAERVNVYGRRQCRRCEGPVTHQMLANRRAWFCARCQPGP